MADTPQTHISASRSPGSPLRSFASTNRFLAELTSPNLRAGYVLVGDETFLLDRCRKGAIGAFVPADLRDLCLHDLDLAETSIFEILDRAQTPSLLAPFQLFFVRNLKLLYTRGAKKEEFAALDSYARSPNPQALLLFQADHLHLPADLRRMDFQDKERFDRIRETLGDWCGLVELARVGEDDAVRWILDTAAAQAVHCDPAAARELADSLGNDMMSIASELEKLILYATAPRTLAQPSGVLSSHLVILSEAHSAQSENLRSSAGAQTPEGQGFSHAEKNPQSPAARITLADVETMVLGAKQRTLYDLTDAISARDRVRAVALLHGLLNSSDSGEDAAIGHLYMLARTFRQMLIILEKNVRDSRSIWQALWQGFRMPPFAADDLIRQARRYKSRRELTRALRLIARADLDIRSSPVSKLLVLERLVLALATEPKALTYDATPQFAMEL